MRHPRCVGTITQKFCVLHFQSNTTILHLVQWENTTTCFGPIGGPSSGCNLDLDISYKRCVWRRGGSRYFNIGCHGLGFFVVCFCCFWPWHPILK